MYGLLAESLKDNLPSKKALEKLEKDYNVKIEDSNIEAEKEQEGVDYYEDNGGIDGQAERQLKKLLDEIYSKFSNIPKSSNKNCNNIPGCVSGYRGYMTQATVFGSKMKERGQTVSQRQRVSALPGFSQHHTGKTFDIISIDDSYWDENPDVKKWVEDNVSKYGFKITYPTNGTLRKAEPWHIYYIGGESSDEKIKQEKNEKIEKKVDDYYADDNKDNPEIEKKIEKRYEIVGCSPRRKYTDSPTFDEVKSDSSVVIRIGHQGKPVEELQKKLVDLGYKIGNCGVDGLFGPRTKKGLEDYQEENGLTVSSAVNQETLKSLEKPASEQKKGVSASENIADISKEDKEFYEKILEGVGAPITEENLKFFYAWRTAEGGDAKNNPFNTKQGMKSDEKISNYNEEGVKNYSTRKFGIEATIKTLLNGRYPCIVDGLKNDVGAKKISECFDNLSTWGTGELVNQVITTDSIRNIPIESDEKSEKGESKSETKTEDKDVKVSKTSDEQYIIIKPDGYTGNKVHVFFGGHSTNPSYSKDGANMSAMKKYVNILKPYANNIIIVITHHMNTLGNVKKYVEEKFGGQVKSIAGFSQGGKETWRHADDSSLSLVGLVDPSTYKTGLPFGSNTILYCDPKNWGTSGFYGETRERLKWYCSHKEEYGDKVVCFNKGGSHMNFGILKDFYSNYGNKI